jgi:hypothetical protein
MNSTSVVAVPTSDFFTPNDRVVLKTVANRRNLQFQCGIQTIMEALNSPCRVMNF